MFQEEYEVAVCVEVGKGTDRMRTPVDHTPLFMKFQESTYGMSLAEEKSVLLHECHYPCSHGDNDSSFLIAVVSPWLIHQKHRLQPSQLVRR